ncbi:hypothetical protein L596_020586 [Steinernema carpocapsae]|uniref:G-protein coupled receptors family 1 profile domain-containing protein n=1 Tax=Steinernema carpocapsae TaxID=34508 RepID=A0A4U5MUM6_STECR|nr:hypothetical protein L596_020586 [Steinernema carpocapsae]
MELYLLRRHTFQSLYNCSYLSDTEWTRLGTPNVLFGTLVILGGIFFSVCYVLAMLVVYRAHRFQLTGNKLLFCGSVMYFNSICTNASLTGYLSITGSMPCPNIEFLYVIRCAEEFSWGCVSVFMVMFIVYRCSELWKPRYIPEAFEGHRTYYWIAAAFLYGLVHSFFARGDFYSSYTYNWSSNLFDGIMEFQFVDPSVYISYATIVHNVGFAATIFPLYLFLTVSIWWKGESKGGKMSKTQKMNIFVAFLLCLVTSIYALIYAYMCLFQLSENGAQIACIIKQLGMGAPAVIHLTMNKTVNAGLLQLFKKKKVTNVTVLADKAKTDDSSN